MSSKYRNFSFLVYPEVMPDNFVSILSNSGGKGFYILHDLDRLEDGTDKKAHYHVVVMFDNPRSLGSVRKLGLKCGAANGHVEPVGNLIGCVRYLCHLDSPDKHEYKASEVASFGGADYLKLSETKTSKRVKRLKIVRELVGFICSNRVYSFAELVEYSCSCRQDWLESLLNPSVGRSIMEYIKSKNWTENGPLRKYGI